MTPIEIFKQKFDKMVDNISASVDNGAGYVIDEVYKILDLLKDTKLPDRLKEAAEKWATTSHFEWVNQVQAGKVGFIAGAEWMKSKYEK